MNKKLVLAKCKLNLNTFYSRENTSPAERQKKYWVTALYEDDKLMDLTCYPTDEESILGNIYVGKVQNIVKNLNAAFIQISPAEKGYYSLDHLKAPVFTKKIGKKPLCIGDELLVQVEKEAMKTKDPYLTTNLNFTGEYLVLTSEDKKTGVSAKLDKSLRTHLKGLLEAHKKDEYGVIVRTNAKNAGDSDILQELEQLEKEFFQVKETAVHKTCYSLVRKPKQGILKTIQDIDFGTLTEIVTDESAAFLEISSYFKNNVNFKGEIRFYEDKLLPLSKLYNLEGEVQNALKEKVWLKSGAYLIIQPTEALTVIDVNSGKNVAKKSTRENFLKINVEAAKEIARQLRLRNISGICIVDFINMDTNEAEEKLMHEFRMELKKDPVAVQLIDITKLGLVELTRKKVKKTLKEQIYFRKTIDE